MKSTFDKGIQKIMFFPYGATPACTCMDEEVHTLYRVYVYVDDCPLAGTRW